HLLRIFDQAMNKPNYLYGIIGLLAGLIIGYIGTNYINQTNRPADTAGKKTASSTNLPPDHPPTEARAGAGATGAGATGATGASGDSSGAVSAPSEMMSSGSDNQSAASAPVKWTRPSRWKAGPPKQMRTATYMIPAAPGDSEEAECTVFM